MTQKIWFIRGLVYGIRMGFITTLQCIIAKILEQRTLIVFIVGVSEAITLYSFRNELKIFIEQYNNSIGPTTITMLIASPIAFIIWSFRNLDKQRDLQHTDENIRQEDFHKIEEWATSNHELPDNKISVLQIAAIYQLVPFLMGEHGERFIRPTIEIYRSLLSSWQLSAKDIEVGMSRGVLLQPEYVHAIYSIISEESNFIRALSRKKNILTEHIWIPMKTFDLKGIMLSLSHFSYVDFRGINFQFATLLGVNFKSANLQLARFQNSKLIKVNFTGANLHSAQFKEANLCGSNFHGADLVGADFTNAVNLKKDKFEGAKNLDKAIGLVFED